MNLITAYPPRAAASRRGCGHERHELIVVQIAASADCVEHHGLRVLRRVGLPHESRLAGIPRAGEVDPSLRDFILQGKRGRVVAGRNPAVGLSHVVEGENNLAGVERCLAAIDRVFPGEKVVVDWRLALLEFAGERLLDAGPVSALLAPAPVTL